MESSLIGDLLNTAQTEVLAGLASAVPAAAAVFAAVAGIGIGIKIFKNVTGARA